MTGVIFQELDSAGEKYSELERLLGEANSTILAVSLSYSAYAFLYFVLSPQYAQQAKSLSNQRLP